MDKETALPEIHVSGGVAYIIMVNHATLMGRLAAHPELKQTKNGVSVVGFRIAVNRTYNRELTDWIDIVAWRQTAEFVVKHFKKGSAIIVEGSIQTRNYEDKNGNKRTAVDVQANGVHVADRGKKNDAGAPISQPLDGFEELDTSDDGDLPF